MEYQSGLVGQRIDGIDGDVVSAEVESGGIVGRISLLHDGQPERWIDVEKPLGEYVGFWRAYGRCRGHDLAVDVGDGYFVGVDYGDASYAGADEAFGRPAADTSDAQHDG